MARSKVVLMKVVGTCVRFGNGPTATVLVLKEIGAGHVNILLDGTLRRNRRVDGRDRWVHGRAYGYDCSRRLR